MEKYQGENIEFILNFEDRGNPELRKFTDLQSLTVYFYTEGCQVIKFHHPAKNGYITFDSVEERMIKGKMKGSDTRILSPGPLTIEIKGVANGKSMINTKETGIMIVKDKIKFEI